MCLHADVLHEVAVAADRAASDITPSSAMLSMAEELRALADAAKERDEHPPITARHFAVLSRLCALALTMPTNTAALPKYRRDLEGDAHAVTAVLARWSLR